MKENSGGLAAKTHDIRAVAVLAYGTFLCAILYLIFLRHAACLSMGLDGATWVAEFAAQADRRPFSQLGVDPLQGNFDAYYPAFREYFLPELLSLMFGAAGIGKAFIYTIYGALMVLATYVLARGVGFSRSVAFLGGALLAVLALPTDPTGPSWLYSIYNILPHLGQAVALTIGIVACFWYIENKRPLVVMAIVAVAVILVLISVVSFVLITILMIPTIAVYGGASIFSSSRRADITSRVVMATACAVVPAILGMAQYAYAVAGYTAYNFFSPEFMQSRADLSYASILYTSPVLGKVLVGAGLVGAVIATVSGSRKVRAFGWTHIVATVVFQAVAFLIVTYAASYHGASPLYFEFMMWPIMSVFAAYAASTICQWVFSAWRMAGGPTSYRLIYILRQVPFAAVPLSLAAIILLARVNHLTTGCEAASFFPVRSTRITRYLEQTIATGVDAPFRGLAATFDGVQGRKSVDWFDFHGNDARLWQAIGNDQRLVGLWWYNIPTLMQYSPTITPPYYLLLTEFLSRPTDRQVRSVLVLTRPNERMLELWGVRFVITDQAPEFGEVRATVAGPAQEEIRLLELRDPNLGNYSPTEVRQVDNFHDGLQLMHGPSFDGRRTLVTEYPLQGAFVEAKGIDLVYRKFGFSVSATSAARSLLVLPVQYSRCWSVAGEGNPVLFRANLMQLGISFSGKLNAELKFRFGPLYASECRIEDIRDMARLGISRARAYWGTSGRMPVPPGQ